MWGEKIGRKKKESVGRDGIDRKPMVVTFGREKGSLEKRRVTIQWKSQGCVTTSRMVINGDEGEVTVAD